MEKMEMMKAGESIGLRVNMESRSKGKTAPKMDERYTRDYDGTYAATRLEHIKEQRKMKRLSYS